MESESKERDSLPADLIYRVTGTGPRAEAAHGKYVRRVLRYLRSRRQVQWLIATEAIARPSAPTPGAIDRSAAENGSDSDSDSSHYSRSADEGNGSTSDDDQADHLIDIRRQLFLNGGTKTADNDSIYMGANNDAPQDLPAAQSAGTGTHPPGSAGAQDATRERGNGQLSPNINNTTANGDVPAVKREDDAAALSSTQLAARRSSRRNLARDAVGRFVKIKEGTAGDGSNASQPGEGVEQESTAAATVTGPPEPSGPPINMVSTDAVQAAYEAGKRVARATADAALAEHIGEFILLKHRRKKSRQRAQRRKRHRNSGRSLAKTLKTVKELSATLHTAEQFGDLSYVLQRELYDYQNAKLYAFLIRSLGEDYAHIVPTEAAGGPSHADGLQCWRMVRLKHAERSASSEAYWLNAFMRTAFASTGSRHSPPNIRTYTRRLTQLSLSYKQANVRNEETLPTNSSTRRIL